MISALELAGLLGRHPPTEQQQAVIEAPLAPALVIAGAGSGKTETMASRVVWLLATGQVRVNEVLGLTFTRKAAGELAQRIGERISQLRLAGILPPDSVELEQATVSTYNSFATEIFRDNAMLLGREPDSVLLSESAAWLLARRVVLASTDPGLVPIGRGVDQLTDAVLELSHELSENVADADAVSRLARDFGSLQDLPVTDGRPKATAYRSVAAAVKELSALPVLVTLAQQFATEKRRRGLIEFSDQVALALAACQAVDTVAAGYRERFKVVLLDEYQDTSVVQTKLLVALFAGHGVMAVGDPHQSIYGWRGASAANLARFAADFGREPAVGAAVGAAGAGAAGSDDAVTTFSLATSWRNARSILDAANVLVEPLRRDGSVAVEPLAARPAAPVGTVRAEFFETVEEEAHAVARWLEDGVSVPREHGGLPSAAILFRNRHHMGLFVNALEQRGVPFHVLGLGGLLSTPEIVDLVCALRVINDPTAGSELIRLLSGARYAIGVRDLQELSNLAGWLHSRDWAQQELSPDVRQRMRNSVAVDDGRSIVDALDFLAEAPPSHGRLASFSPAGLARLREAGRTFASLRSRAGLGLLDLVRLVEQEFLLDIEVGANDSKHAGFANLYAFYDEVENFLAVDDLGTLGSFLGWLKRAEQHDVMGPRSEAAESGTVQLLTIHGAKGLEWDLVAVPRLVSDELPGKAREGTGWLRFGKLPYEFRGDAAELPALKWRTVKNQKEFDGNLKEFATALSERHQAEERRLGYVALTRAREALLLTGSFWAGGTKARAVSPFLLELSERAIVGDLPRQSAFAQNPTAGTELVESWPLDPLGSRRSTVEQAARLVAAADADADAGRYQRDLELLLAERRQNLLGNEFVPLPSRVAASRFKDFIAEPAAVAASLRRPLPQRPYRATRLGTLFHSWVEQRYGSGGRADLIDASPIELDDEPGEVPADSAELRRLQQIFERSEFAAVKPEEVELEIHLVLEGQVIVCKLDAVFRQDDRYRIVDWKTGKAPEDEADLELKQLQLALYRLAFARWKGIDPDRIDALFYYVSDDRIIRPERVFDEAELVTLWRGSTG